MIDILLAGLIIVIAVVGGIASYLTDRKNLEEIYKREAALKDDDGSI